MITRREMLRIAAIGAAGTFGSKMLLPTEVSAIEPSSEASCLASLRFVAPRCAGTGMSLDSAGSVLNIPKWIEECDTLVVLFAPGQYEEYLRIENVPENKRVVLQGDPSGESVFLSKDGSTNGSVLISNSHNVTLRDIHFRQEGRDLKWFLNVTGSRDCLIERCSWVGLSCRYGAATIQNESERVTMSDCHFEDTGNRGNTGSGAHQLYISGGGDNATTGYARDIHVTRCTFADHFAGQHLKFKNGSRDCFVDRCTFVRTNGETFGRFLNIRNVGDPNTGYPIVTNIFVMRCLFKDTTGTPCSVVNPAPRGHPDRFVFAQNAVEGNITDLPGS